jgi:thymidylate kinase
LRRRVAAFRGPSGLSVAIVGPDGAGKTTLVSGLQDTMPLPVTVQYMGLTGGRMPRADALRVPGLVLAARLAILWARYGSAMLDRRRGRLVLFDRYTLDGAVPPGVRIGRLGRLSRYVQRRACPMPDLVLFLDASGSTMHARKGEYDPATLESWRAAYGRLRGSVEALEAIDAERSVEEVRRDAAARIWRRYRERRLGLLDRQGPAS